MTTMNTEFIKETDFLSLSRLFKGLLVLFIITTASLLIAWATGLPRWIPFVVVVAVVFVVTLYSAVTNLPPSITELTEERDSAIEERDQVLKDLEQSEANVQKMYDSKESFKTQLQQSQQAVKQIDRDRMEMINNYEQQLKTARDKISKLENEVSEQKQINKQAEQTIISLEQIETNYEEAKAKLAEFAELEAIYKKFPGLFSNDPEELKAAHTSRQRSLAGAKRGKASEEGEEA